METKENGVELSNRLIAEFMGYDYHKGLFIHRDAETPIGNTIKPDELQYHSSWDWLMPVVEKIWEMQRNPNEMFMGTTVERLINFSEVTSLHIYMPINIVWERVTKFIQWYNTQTTTPSLPGDNNKK